ncbi:DUF3139 domain-containing protein [uncultured Helcococcus sp.]|uniref:DUF3139 domain-containing protein n=1 Tax=uncultured Helcococcus sp. TaxID=1072508 RepID=UPI002639B86B|nr:DUF3139 domain-containing protein [uncultured Helcococcus sp.]
MKKWISGTIIAIIIVMFIYILFISKILFEKNVDKYISSEGISAEEIIEKKIYRDSKQGGYIAKIRFKKDRNYNYIFELHGYNPLEYFDYNNINISIYDNENAEYTISKVLEKPIYFIED